MRKKNAEYVKSRGGRLTVNVFAMKTQELLLQG